MGIDAQRSGASELPDRAVDVRRAQGANSGPGNWQRKSTQAPSTTKAIPVWIVEEERRRRRGPDRTRALRGSAIGLPPRRRPQGWRACVSPLMRAHVSGPPADVAVFMATSTKRRASPGLARRGESLPAPLPAGRLRL